MWRHLIFFLLRLKKPEFVFEKNIKFMPDCKIPDVYGLRLDQYRN